MLQSIRDRLNSGPVIWVIVGLICIPMAFFGIESFRTTGASTPIAEVGDEEIYEPQVQQAIQRQYQQFRAMFGDQFQPEMLDDAMMRRTAIDQLVRDALLRQYAEQAGFRSSDEAVLAYLRDIPQFQQDGRFSGEAYRAVLAREGLTPQEFERRVAEALAIEQMRQTVIGTSFVTPVQVSAQQRVLRQQREITTAQFAMAAYRDSVEVSDDAIASYYADQAQRFAEPEQVRLAWVELDADDMPQAEDPGDEMLMALYDAEGPSRFALPESVTARHILFAFGDDRAAARERAEQALAEIRGGADFAAVAAEQSDDPGSAEQGGELGTLTRGSLDPALEDALFAAPIGEVGGPVATDFGWHVYRVDGRESGSVRPFEDADVRSALLELYREREARARFEAQAETLERLAFESEDSLAPVADALGVEVQQSDWIPRGGGSGIASYPQVMDAAFDPLVVESGENSEPIEVEPGRLVVLRVLEHKPASTAPLESVREDIREQLVVREATAAAREDAERAAAAVRSGTPLADAIAEYPAATLGERRSVGRDADDVDAAVLRQAFSLPRPEGGIPQTGIAQGAGGDLVLVVLASVVEPAADARPAESDLQMMREARAGTEFIGFEEAMESVISVEMHAEVADPES